MTTIAYLSDGKLFVKTPDAPAKLIQSPFVQQMLDRQQRDRQRQGWKEQGAWNFGISGPRMQRAQTGVRRVRFSGVASGGNRLFYSIDTDSAGAIFEYDSSDDSERRMLHRAGLLARDVARHPTDSSLAMTIVANDGSAHVAVLNSDGRGIRELTEGDSLDQSPAWSGSKPRELFFQSAGLGRNPAGLVVGQSPYAICRLDLDRDEFETLVESEKFDYLQPQNPGDGSLYYIRRPYRANQRRVSPIKALGDIVLFPFRLARAIVHFLDFFSRIFSREPLITAGGPPKEPAESRYMMLWGMVVDTESAMRAKNATDAGGLVPKNWELIRRSADGNETSLAPGVLSFDVRPDGTVLYTNGTRIFQLDPNGQRTEVASDRVVEKVIWA